MTAIESLNLGPGSIYRYPESRMDSSIWGPCVRRGDIYSSYLASQRSKGSVYTWYSFLVYWSSSIGLCCIQSFMWIAYHQCNCLILVSIGIMQCCIGACYSCCLSSIFCVFQLMGVWLGHYLSELADYIIVRLLLYISW